MYGEARIKGLACENISQIRFENEEGKSSISPSGPWRHGIESGFIYRPDTVNYEKGNPRISKQSVNV
jgi:hypothetical protein